MEYFFYKYSEVSATLQALKVVADQFEAKVSTDKNLYLKKPKSAIEP